MGRCVRANVGELTFEEAYNMTKMGWAIHAQLPISPWQDAKLVLSHRRSRVSSEVMMKPVRL